MPDAAALWSFVEGVEGGSIFVREATLRHELVNGGRTQSPQAQVKTSLSINAHRTLAVRDRTRPHQRPQRVVSMRTKRAFGKPMPRNNVSYRARETG